MDTEQNIFPGDAAVGIGARPTGKVAVPNTDDSIREAPDGGGARRDRTWFWLLGFAGFIAVCLFVYDRTCWAYGVGSRPFLIVFEVTDADTGRRVNTATVFVFSPSLNSGAGEEEEFTTHVDGRGCLSLYYRRVGTLQDWSGLGLTYNGGVWTPACRYDVTAPGYERTGLLQVPHQHFKGTPPPTQIVRVALRKK